MVEKVYQGGSYQLVDCKGDRPMLPINGMGGFLRKTMCDDVVMKICNKMTNFSAYMLFSSL